ncbi:transketolase C-terminal domain-containing protein [Ponticoccus litoralis]|uniref:Transketolase C-terminal domain-containing protein n=1 Tax=Ponticoccus litoralis TaxID=422297 RepID=A0AAW9S959_9RHOB
MAPSCTCPRSNRSTPRPSAPRPRNPYRLVVTAENHSLIGGLGEAVATALMTGGIHPSFRMIGLPDEFLDAGALPTLHHQYGISVEAICASVKSWL